MRLVTTLVLIGCLARSADARRPIEPVRHERYSPNGRYLLDFDPESNHHTIYASNDRNIALWSFDGDAYWPYGRGEWDGCLFVADDGLTVAGPAWMPMVGMPEGRRTFDGLEFWGPNGPIASYRVSDVTWGLGYLDIPIWIVWIALDSDYRQRGSGYTRTGDHLHVTRLAPRSLTFSLRTGEIESWSLNFGYLALLVFVYGPPLWIVGRWIARLRRTAPTAAARGPRKQPFVVRNFASVLVAINSSGVVLAGIMDFASGDFERHSAALFGVTQMFSVALIGIAVVFSLAGMIATPRRFDIVGPWLAIMSAAIIHAMFTI